MRRINQFKLGSPAAPHVSLGAKLLALPRGRFVLFCAPLFIAFVAAAAGIGAPERVLGVIAAVGIGLHIAGLVSCRHELKRLDTPARTAVNDNTLAEIRQWHVAQAYLLGALKLRAPDDTTRQLAAEAEDAAYGALAMLEKMSSGHENGAAPAGAAPSNLDLK